MKFYVALIVDDDYIGVLWATLTRLVIEAEWLELAATYLLDSDSRCYLPNSEFDILEVDGDLPLYQHLYSLSSQGDMKQLTYFGRDTEPHTFKLLNELSTRSKLLLSTQSYTIMLNNFVRYGCRSAGLDEDDMTTWQLVRQNILRKPADYMELAEEFLDASYELH